MKKHIALNNSSAVLAPSPPPPPPQGMTALQTFRSPNTTKPNSTATSAPVFTPQACKRGEFLYK